ncbi:FAD:protein FMN transferase [uncultured Bacteroides sp.]|uniref:FAD:protein FMN transferase n=1 Tax=uncultured Bacteroides sp. TaxID=162156 RepID=UPI002AABDEDD|nr:FAD:protein FMN transferase [uncultured Bacteroides sp.]
MENKKSRLHLLWIIPFILGTIYIIRREQQKPYNSIEGLVFGTVYHVTYQYDDDLKPEIDKAFKHFDGSLSTFNDTSVISRVNQNKEVVLDSLFLNVFNRSMQISKETNGAFDITVAPLVNAWGFGFKKRKQVDSLTIDSLMQLTGYEKIAIKDGKVIKQDPRMMLDCSAVAKGYASDYIANLLKSKGIKNYMVEIGGEIVAKGFNPKKEAWRIGVNKPVDDSLSQNQELEAILQLTDVGMATSGNYRNFYYKNGKKYAHTIDPHSGYPVQHSLLSSTVVAKDCMTADALATAFMVMGIEKAEAFADAHPEIEAYFIYSDEKGNLKNYFTKNMKKYVAQE